MVKKKHIKAQRIAQICTISALFLICLPAFAASEAADDQIRQDKMQSLAEKFMHTIAPKISSLIASDPAYVDNLSDEALNKARFKAILDGEDLIFQTLTKRVILSDGMLGTKRNGAIYISLFEFLAAVDFPIQINLDEDTASGWFIREEKEFYLDLLQYFAESDGRRYDLNKNDVIKENSDILVKKSVLEAWFDLGLDIQLESMTVIVESEFPLPVEERLNRQERAKNFSRTTNRANLPYKKEPYKAISEPFVDVQLNQTFNKRPERDTQSASRYSIIAGADVAYTNAEFFIGGDNEESVEEIRISLNKKAEEGETLLPFGVDEFTIGDLNSVRLPIVEDASQERGIRFSSNKDTDDVTDTVRFEGDIQPGWDVELYRNDILIEFQTIGAESRYEFQNVELFFGDNDFRLVFYGPQGQIREEFKNIPIIGNRLKRGEPAYDISLTQRDKITFREQEIASIDRGAPNLVTKFEYGLTDNLLLSTGSRYWERNGEGQFLSLLGLQTTQNNFLYDLNVARESTGGLALEGIATGKVGKNSIRLTQLFNTDDFDTDDETDDNQISETDLRFQGRLTPKVNYNARGIYSVFESGNVQAEADASFSTNINRVNVNKSFDYTFDDFDLTDEERYGGSLSLTGVANGIHWRTRGNYDVVPDLELNSFLVSGLKPVSKNLSAEFELENFFENDLTEGRLALNFRNDHFILTPRFSYDSDQEATAFMAMNFGLGHDPYSNKFVMSRNRLASSGGVSARAFLDENANNLYDEGEEPLEGVSIIAQHTKYREKTDKDGYAFLPGLREGVVTDVAIDHEKLADPFWLPMHAGNSINPRGGVVTQIDFPIVIAGEVDGTIGITGQFEEKRPARQVNVQLLSMEGEVVKTVKTAYDGFYLFGDVAPGEYLVHVSNTETSSRGMRPVKDKWVNIGADGTIINGIDFALYSEKLSGDFVALAQQQDKDDYAIVVRLGKYRSDLLRTVKWFKMSRSYPSLFAGMNPNYTDKGRGKYLDVGPFSSIDRARDICAALKQNGQDCSLSISQI